VTDLIGLISVPYPELSFRLNIEALNNLNDLKVLKEEFEEHARSFCENAFTIYSEEIGDQEVKIACLQQLVGTLINLTILGKENYSTFITNLIANTSKYVKRADQTLASMICAILYFNKNIQDTVKVKESLLKAKKFAEYSMTNPQNISLFIILLNKYIYFVEKECTSIDHEMFNDILDSIKNHFETIRTENREAPFLSEAERFLQETIETLGKKAETKEFYKQLNLN
jgi:vacuolar protein sorting-associated protein 35